MKILAFDPGSSYTGWCLLFGPGSVIPVPGPNHKVDPLSWGTIQAPTGDMPATVLSFLHHHRPDVIACEKSFPPKHTAVYAKNWEKTAEVRGVIKSFVGPEVRFFELSSSEVRAALKISRLERRRYNVYKIKGLGGLTQDARVKEALCKLTGIAKEQFKTSHEVDAVALAFVVCSRLGISWQ